MSLAEQVQVSQSYASIVLWGRAPEDVALLLAPEAGSQQPDQPQTLRGMLCSAAAQQLPQQGRLLHMSRPLHIQVCRSICTPALRETPLDTLPSEVH